MFQKLKNTITDKLYTLLEKYGENRRYQQMKSIAFSKIGVNHRIGKDYRILNPQNIEIGDNFRSLERLRMEAIKEYAGVTFNPKLKIGNNVSINNDVHIGCIDRVEIGNNCLLASRIYISDHDHGIFTEEMLRIAPSERPLLSKGPVIIKDNVWIGEGAAILSGVTIGENAIIATNAVVTKDVPANCIAGGIPAKVIKELKI